MRKYVQEFKLMKNGVEFHVGFTRGKSRGYDTYGYNVVSCYVDGVKKGSCKGGGYDMQGVSASKWLEKFVKNDMEFYGLNRKENGLYYLDGGTGFEYLVRQLGFTIERL